MTAEHMQDQDFSDIEGYEREGNEPFLHWIYTRNGETPERRFAAAEAGLRLNPDDSLWQARVASGLPPSDEEFSRAAKERMARREREQQERKEAAEEERRARRAEDEDFEVPPGASDEEIQELILAKARKKAYPKLINILAEKEARAFAQEIESAKNPARFVVELVEDIPDAETKWSMEGLWPAGGVPLVIGQYKAGKSTAMANAVTARIHGTDYLGRFPSVPITGRVAYLNYELMAWQFRDWTMSMGMPIDRLLAVNLRGHRNPFALEADKRLLGEQLQAAGVELLVIDPFANAFRGWGDDQQSNTQVGEWWGMVAAWTKEYGIAEWMVGAHAGRQGEHARGASALEDNADTIWTITKVKDGRAFKALPRGADEVEEDALTFDPDTKLLTLAGTGSASKAALRAWFEEVKPVVLEIVGKSPGINVSGITKALKEAGITVKNGSVGKLSEHGEDAGWWKVSSPTPASRERRHVIDPDARELPEWLRPAP